MDQAAVDRVAAAADLSPGTSQQRLAGGGARGVVDNLARLLNFPTGSRVSRPQGTPSAEFGHASEVGESRQTLPAAPSAAE
eukprot:5226211-Lingulodinium_polyedra.AAC.1